MFIQQNKSVLRKIFKTKRQAISQQDRLEAAKKAAIIFQQTIYFKQANKIAVYFATNSEFDVSTMIETIWQNHKICYVPYIANEEKKELKFVEYTAENALHFNRFKILEPIKKEHPIALDELDLVILPLLAFDRSGHRLGTGGGYYDKTFAFKSEKNMKKPVMIGAAFSVQEAANLPSDEWDVRLDGVITESEFIDCLKSAPAAHAQQ